MAWTDVAPSVSAAAAALAAGASWASVQLATRERRAAVRPELHGQGLMVQNYGRLDLVVHNAGGGLAKGTAAVVLVPSTRQCAFGTIGDGFLRPNEDFYVTTGCTIAEQALGVLVCRDVTETTWAWNLAGERRKLNTSRKRKRDGQPLTQREMTAAFYPEFNVDKFDRQLFKLDRKGAG